METEFLPIAAEKPPKLRWYQYSLRSLLLFVTACAIACSWLAVTIQGQRRQHEAADAIKKAGGTVASEQTWLGKVLRDDSLVNVTVVDLSNEAAADAGLVHLQGLSQLQWLLLGNSKVTDAGLVHLQGLSQLLILDLAWTKVTDAGLVNLQGLRQLEFLELAGTKLTDAGLANLQGLKQLNRLVLTGTKVTDQGVKILHQALPNCSIQR